MKRADDIARVGVIGAGTMGNGIAHVFALAGADVRLVDVDDEALSRGLAAIETNLGRQVAKDRIEASAASDALERISSSTELASLGEAEVVVEAASEDRELKLDLFGRVSAIAPEDALLASNTSSISITAIASAASHPERVIGMHFMNPVPLMELVEVIRGLETSDDAADLTLGLCRRLSKTPVLANDFPGFVSNRILMPMINEAIYCLMEGVADREAIDDVMRLGMKHPIGPLALADLI
ncbi:MAG: 3-hydroxyacyl-CoA dehydrogenase NAD-binding domain-containing protein, partial [Gemmatimonadota bacterium]|nr:3-hydroxyacyl-CoA dehydrogenase NAD-binding domain-containing protein [Gemmatimonadota bacterium]